MERMRVARAAGIALAVVAVTAATACATNRTTAGAHPPAPAVSVTPATLPSPAPKPTTVATPQPAAPPTAAGVYVEYVHNGGGNLLYVMAPGGHSWKLLGSVPDPVFNDQTENIYGPSRDMRRALVTDNTDRTLWNRALDGTDRQVVVQPHKGYAVCNAQFDARADRILYGVMKPPGNVVTVYTVRADGTDRHTVPDATTYDACYGAFAPSGSTYVFMNTYKSGLPIREYHEVHVFDGTRTREITLKLPNTVHAGTPDVVSADGHYMVIGARTVNAQGECGDGDDRWFIADLRTGATHELKVANGYVSTGDARFDGSDRLVTMVQRNVEVNGQNVSTTTVGVFDTHARLVKNINLPDTSADEASFVLWTVVA